MDLFAPIRAALYKNYLEHERGLAPLTIGQHLRTARQLLEQIGCEDGSSSLCDLTASEIETFVVVLARQRSRRTMQQAVAQIRSFLRFLGARGHVKRGLDTEIDTPRVYRGERLPRALPWETVRAFLDSIDGTSALGLRDYAIFLLIATYGLRASEVVALTLDDIDWRGGRILIGQRKTVNPLLLPLTDDVGTCLVDYLRRGRPSLPWRELFMRTVAPAGALTPKAVTHAFIRWSKRSGLEIPFHGPHCLRHSYAVHLLRQGTSLKTIGDILGHRTAESTQVGRVKKRPSAISARMAPVDSESGVSARSQLVRTILSQCWSARATAQSLVIARLRTLL